MSTGNQKAEPMNHIDGAIAEIRQKIENLQAVILLLEQIKGDPPATGNGVRPAAVVLHTEPPARGRGRPRAPRLPKRHEDQIKVGGGVGAAVQEVLDGYSPGVRFCNKDIADAMIRKYPALEAKRKDDCVRLLDRVSKGSLMSEGKGSQRRYWIPDRRSPTEKLHASIRSEIDSKQPKEN